MIRNFLAIPELQSPGLIFLLLITAYVLITQKRSGTISHAYAMMVLALNVSIFAYLATLFYNFIVDDVFISLRYARNLADGYGLVFSTDNSRPIEGYTNFLWVLMEAPLFMMNLSDEAIIHTIRILGLIFGAGVIVMTYFLIHLLTSDKRASLIGSAFLSVVPEFSFWAIGGLETSMYMFWMVLGVYRYLVEKRKQQMHLWSMIFLFLMALTRPEGLFFAGAVVFFDAVQTFSTRKNDVFKANQELKHALIGAGIFALLYAIYFLWRFNFYELPFPNSYYAKKMRSVGYMIHRFRQVSKFIVPLLPFLSLACLGYFYLNKNVSREKEMVLFLMLVLFSFSFAARNEWMPGFRYELPFLPLMMVFFSVGMSKIIAHTEQDWGWQWQTRMAHFLALFFLGLLLMYQVPDLRKTGNNFTSSLQRAHVPLGKWLNKYAPANASYASWDMGAVPYYSHIPGIVDINSEGLLNTYTTFHGYDIDRFLAANPTFLVLPPNTSYVRPAEIRDFYTKEKLKTDYEFLFSFAFDKEYLLNVYKHKSVVISDEAIQEGKVLAEESMIGFQ